MIRDIFNIVNKELIELRRNKEFIVYYCMFILVLGILIPISSKDSILHNNWYVVGLTFQIIAITIPANLTADTFAGEKERKTLETLLFTPVSITILYIGKVIFIMLIALLVTLLCFIVNYLTVFIMYYKAYGIIHFKIYSAISLYTMLINTLIISSFETLLGTLFSIKLKSARGAGMINFFIGAPLIAPMAMRLYTTNITWKFIFKYEIVLIVLDFILILLVKRFFTRDTIMRSI
ncbi:hypothetical protein [Caloranaerobacter sp. DY30410]|uniref:hypothetical protein n=1 Tax=Caloranaerobacter sp. DY30410 TaxID=3238305 RepID=UPI003D00A3A8